MSSNLQREEGRSWSPCLAVALDGPGAAAKEVTLLNMRSQQAGAELGGLLVRSDGHRLILGRIRGFTQDLFTYWQAGRKEELWWSTILAPRL